MKMHITRIIAFVTAISLCLLCAAAIWDNLTSNEATEPPIENAGAITDDTQSDPVKPSRAALKGAAAATKAAPQSTSGTVEAESEPRSPDTPENADPVPEAADTPDPMPQEPSPAAETPAQETSLDPSETEPAESRYAALCISDEDIDILAAIVYLEARGEPFEGQVAVAEVVLNRVLSDRFPDSVCEVVYQTGQFTPADKVGAVSPGEEQYEAVATAIAAVEPVLGADVVFFSGAPYNDRVYTVIGNHYFCSL